MKTVKKSSIPEHIWRKFESEIAEKERIRLINAGIIRPKKKEKE